MTQSLALASLVATLALCASAQPHSHSCLPPLDGFLWCNTSLPVSARVAALVAALTPEEKASLLYDGQPAIARLGLDFWNTNLEGLHGLGAHCLTDADGVHCPTIFPAPPALGAAFNTSLMTAIGIAISDEVRAGNNNNLTRNYANRPVDLGLWLPSINLAINFLWGRNIEVYSEDPLHAGRLAAHLIRAVQWGGGAPGNGTVKVFGITKHYTGYQVEANRFGFDAAVSEHDLVMTYLLPWQILAAEGGNAGAMCAYPALNGIPMCGSPVLETGVLREEFQMGIPSGDGDGAVFSMIQADCGAVGFMNSAHHYVDTDVAAAALALNSGTDVDCSRTMPDNILQAIAANMTSMGQLDASLTRTLGLHFLAGRFDPLEAQPYTRIPLSALGAPAHAALSFDAALQGMVLLRNDAGVLPLSAGRSVAVIGPFANDSADMAGNYFEDVCSNDGSDFSCVPSLLAAVRGANAGGATAFAAGCDMVNASASDIPAAVAAAAAADVSILALGINGAVCGEGADRTSLALPGAQAALAAAVLALGKPAVVVVFAGAPLDVAAIAARAAPTAIVLGGPPGNAGGAPVALQLFGGANRWGRTTFSHYFGNVSDALPPTSYDMTTAPGRTYKYTTLPLIWPFGAGGSYTSFRVAPVGASPRVRLRGCAAIAAGAANVVVNVSNTGARAGDDVVLIFVEPQASVARNVPGGNDTLARRVLADFARVALAPGESVLLSFNLTTRAFGTGTHAGDVVLAAGDYVVRATDDTGRAGAGDALFHFAVELDEDAASSSGAGAGGEAARFELIAANPVRAAEARMRMRRGGAA